MYKRNIIRMLRAMSGGKLPKEVFIDWIECLALTIQNGCCIVKDHTWHEREEQYLRCIRSYGIGSEKDVQEKFGQMAAMLVMAMEQEVQDVLGDIYMEAGFEDKGKGQFFTTFNISYLGAQMTLGEEDRSRTITLHEPAAGTGGMIIAVAKVLQDRGINYQRCLKVEAQELSWNAVYMCYVQLSLLGIDAVIAQGNSLTEPYTGTGYPPGRVFYTPKRMGMLL